MCDLLLCECKDELEMWISRKRFQAEGINQGTDVSTNSQDACGNVWGLEEGDEQKYNKKCVSKKTSF